MTREQITENWLDGPLPGLLLHRDQSQVAVGARKTIFETASRFDLPTTIAVTVSFNRSILPERFEPVRRELRIADSLYASANAGRRGSPARRWRV